GEVRRREWPGMTCWRGKRKGVRRGGLPLAQRTPAARAALCLAALVAFAIWGDPPASAQTTTSVKTSNLKCRNHIGAAVQELGHNGLEAVAPCYDRRRGGEPCDHISH